MPSPVVPRPSTSLGPLTASRLTATRRTVLLGGLAVLSGCSLTDPVVHGSAAEVTPSPTPTVPPAQANAATRLAGLASWCELASTTADAAARPAAAAAARAFTSQAQVLGRPDPFAAQPSSSASPTPSASTSPPTGNLVAAIAAQTKAAAAEFASQAGQASGQDLRLLWLSLSLAATAAGPLTRPLQASTAQPARFADVPASQRRSVVVEQLHRAAFAHEACAGALPSGDLRTSVMSALAQLQAEIATEQARLRADKVEVPAQHPGYQLPARPSASNTGTILAAVSRDLLDARAGLASALTGEDASAELTKAAKLIGTVHGWGGSLRTWPGWVS